MDGFEMTYQVEVDPEMGAENPVDIGNSGGGRSVPLLVRFEPDIGRPWVGRFWGGQECGLTGVYSWPDPGTACVVVSGVTYCGLANDASSWAELTPEPTTDMVPFLDLHVVALCDHWNVYGYGKQGEIWRARDVAVDGFSVLEGDADSLLIEVERDEDDARILRIDARTGAISESSD